MKQAFLVIALALVAGCSGRNDASPATSETGTGAGKAARATAKPTETPMTADRCIEENKGPVSAARNESTKTCLTEACDLGDQKSCDMVVAYIPGGERDKSNEDDTQDPTAE